MKSNLNVNLPPGWKLVQANVAHPSDPHGLGDLCRCEATGVYALITAGVVRSVPQRWAAQVAGGVEGAARAAARMTPEQREARARAGAAARWGECRLQTRKAHGWVDVESPAPESTLDGCRDALTWIRQERQRERSWAAEYRIVRVDADENVVGVVDYCDLSM